MINGAERSIAGSGDVASLFVRLMQPGSHYLQPLCVPAKQRSLCFPPSFHREERVENEERGSSFHLFNPESVQIKKTEMLIREKAKVAPVCCLVSSITDDGLRRAAFFCGDKNTTFSISNPPHVCDVTLRPNFSMTHRRISIKFYIF